MNLKQAVIKMNYSELTIRDASKLIQAQKLSPIKLLENLYKRIEKIEPIIEAFVTLNKEKALLTAEKRLKEIEEGTIASKNLYYAARKIFGV